MVSRASLFEGIKEDSSRLKSDFSELISVRWKLAKHEVQTAVHSVRRLVVALAIAAVLVLTALPVLIVALAKIWDGWLNIPFAGWLAIFGFGMLVIAGLLAWFRYRRFREEFIGLEQSLEEFREDLLWLEERLTRHRRDGHGESGYEEMPDRARF